MLRTCPECEKYTVPVGVWPWSKNSVQCNNCGAEFKLKKSKLWILVTFVEAVIPFAFLIALIYTVIYWYLAIPGALICLFYFSYLKARFAKLQLTGIRAVLKEKGVNLDPQKLARAKMRQP